MDVNLNKLSIDKSNWKLIKFGDVASEPKENVKDLLGEGIEHVVGLEHINSEDIHLRRSVNIETSTTFNKKFAKGDVLFGRRRAYLKKVAQAPFSGICSGDITVFRAKDSILPELLPFIVCNDKFFDFAVKHSAGGLSPRVKFKDLANYQFLLPPKDQQKQLAELLWAMDDVIEKERMLLEKLKILKNRKKELFFIKGNKQKNLKSFFSYKVPNNWEIKKMSDIANVEYGISESVANNTDPKIGWPIITSANIELDGSFNLDKKRYIEIPSNERFLLKLGDLLFNWRSGSPEHIGKTAFFNLNQDYTYASFILRIRCGNEIKNRFLYYLLNYLREIEFFTKNIAQQVNFKINASIFREVEVPVPPINEQENMLKELELLFEQEQIIKSKLTSSQALQKSLINQIF